MYHCTGMYWPDMKEKLLCTTVQVCTDPTWRKNFYVPLYELNFTGACHRLSHSSQKPHTRFISGFFVRNIQLKPVMHRYNNVRNYNNLGSDWREMGGSPQLSRSIDTVVLQVHRSKIFFQIFVLSWKLSVSFKSKLPFIRDVRGHLCSL